MRNKALLLAPVSVEWVHFSLQDGHSVGILKRPMEIPPEDQVQDNVYMYDPCPLDLLPPVPDNTFMHLLENPGPHKRALWLHRLPKKVNASILSSTDDLIVGWGIHIIEGTNWLMVSIVAFLVMVLSGVFGILWSVYRSDVSGGFGVAAWMTGILTSMIMVYFNK